MDRVFHLVLYSLLLVPKECFEILIKADTVYFL